MLPGKPTDDATDDALRRISLALGRSVVPSVIATAPGMDESLARLVEPTVDLAREFTRAAAAAGALIVPAEPSRLAYQVLEALYERDIGRVVAVRSGLVATLDLVHHLQVGGLEATWWDETSLDAAYETDAGITDVWFAVAETGSLVIRSSPRAGRAVSLVPPLHLAIVQRSQIVPDLIDAMRLIDLEGPATGAVFITGPSKTSDIEMTLVTGIHGPTEVMVFLLETP